MAGSASYTDPQVMDAMAKWKELVDAGYFAPNANADDWTDASDKVARGDAAMTLMGTWITGYWNSNELQPGADYDFFPVPGHDRRRRQRRCRSRRRPPDRQRRRQCRTMPKNSWPI